MGRSILLGALLFSLLATASQAAIFDQPHDGGATLHKSSWYPPDGLDGDAYCWDNFSVGASAAIAEVRWRGGYEFHPSGSGQSPVSDFDISIYRSITGNSQPDLGTGGLLAHYMVGGNAGEVSAGSFAGVALYDYAFQLPSPFQAAAGTVYWIRIEASQGLAAPSYAPDWGLAVGTGGNNSHFRFTTGSIYQVVANDLAFSLFASAGPNVTIAASASPVGAGTVSGAGGYPVGSTATLTATPAAGWGFVNWTEGGVQVSTQSTYSFIANVNRTLVAHFDTTYQVVTSAYPSYAGVTTGDGACLAGQSVMVTATPNHGFVFGSWSDGATTATHSFTPASDVLLTAFFVSAPAAVTYDFDAGPVHSSLPLSWTINRLTAQFSGGYSVQPVGTVGISPAGFSGLCLWPNSVFASDLEISFSEKLIDCSVLYAVDELACDTSARMRMTAFMDATQVGTSTTQAQPGVYPSATLGIAVPAGFNRVVVHWDAPGTLCQDYGPIFFADNVTVTRAVAPASVESGDARDLPRLERPAPNPFHGGTAIRFVLPSPGEVRLSIHDLAGRLVCELLHGPAPAGARTVFWDGRDHAGTRVKPGVYLARFESAGRVQDRRVICVR